MTSARSVLAAVSVSLLAACSAGPMSLAEIAPAMAQVSIANAITEEYPGRSLEDLQASIDLFSSRTDCPSLPRGATVTFNGHPMKVRWEGGRDLIKGGCITPQYVVTVPRAELPSEPADAVFVIDDGESQLRVEVPRAFGPYGMVPARSDLNPETPSNVARGEALSFRVVPAGVAWEDDPFAIFIRDEYNSDILDGATREADVVRTTVPASLAAGKGTLILGVGKDVTPSRCEGATRCSARIGVRASFLLTVQ